MIRSLSSLGLVIDAQKNPAGAVELAATLPEKQKKSAYQTIASQWGTKDAPAASEWLRELPDSPAKDSAINGFASAVIRKDPQSAIDWASSIGDETQRRSSLTNFFHQWKSRDAEAAGEWLKDTEVFSPEEKSGRKAPRKTEVPHSHTGVQVFGL